MTESEITIQFSPHTRGCIDFTDKIREMGRVFPAHAGLYRWLPKSSLLLSRFPRTRGVVSRAEMEP